MDTGIVSAMAAVFGSLVGGSATAATDKADALGWLMN